MQITEKQRKRAEENRQAALAKRQAKALASAPSTAAPVPARGPWGIFPCRKILHNNINNNSRPSVGSNNRQQLIVTLEICSPSAFSVSAEPASELTPAARDECFSHLHDSLSHVSQTQLNAVKHGENKLIYSLKDYDLVIKIIRQLQNIKLQQVPWTTIAVLCKLACLSNNKESTSPISNYLSDAEVDRLIAKLPRELKDGLLPFQFDGVRFGLRRSGRCLIADEMGVGKTVQAIAIASCYMEEGPILVVCPASMRFTWAEELERWLPFCSPRDIHLVFGQKDNPYELAKCPKIVIISYTMLSRLRKSVITMKWSVVVVDESHNLRCTKKPTECEETQAALDVAKAVKHVVLLSGTPSLSRPYDIFHQIDILWPGLLGKDKYDFARNYCNMQLIQLRQGRTFKDYSKGVRLQELYVLLKETVMIRRMKENVLAQLPPKRRQVIRLMLSTEDISYAKTCISVEDKREECNNCKCGFTTKGSCSCEDEDSYDSDTDDEENRDLQESVPKGPARKRVPARFLSHQEVGIAKIRCFQDWLSNHDICANSEDMSIDQCSLSTQKMVVFAHHLRVLEGIQEIVCQKGIEFVRIDGSTFSRDRQLAVQAFRSRPEVKIAIVGVTAGGVGLDFCAAQSVVFVEIPKTASEMIQAEDRVHRRGLKSSVNIYIFCAKDTSDESQWQQLNRSLERVSTMTNGVDGCMKELEVDHVVSMDDQSAKETGECQEFFEDDAVIHNQTDGAISEKIFSASSNVSHADIVVSCEFVPELKAVPADLTACNHESRLSSEGEAATSDEYSNAPEKEAFNKDENGKSCISSKNVSESSRCLDSSEPTLSKIRELHPGRCDEGWTKSMSSQVLYMKECSSSENSLLQEQKEQKENIVATESNFCSSRENQTAVNKQDFESPADSLLFEVSANTGRIHLYTCNFDEESRPRQLSLNFLPEDLDLPSTSLPILSNPSSRNCIIIFIEEWNRLRPVDRNKLFGRPLRLPLCVELSCIKSESRYTAEGTLKGGSKKRVAERDEISDPLPENATLRKVCFYKNYKTKERHEMQAWSAEGEPLCKLCQSSCRGSKAKSPEYFEDMFCKVSCFEEYRMRTSQKYLREVLFSIEHGICTHCKLDCHTLVRTIRPLSKERRREYILKAAPTFAEHERLLEKLLKEPSEGNAWHADHIIPVYKGGGQCKVENMRTLCVICHAKVTAEQQEDRRLRRGRAKDTLQLTIEKFIERVCQKRMKLCTQVSPIKAADDEDLLVDVLGSAYSDKPHS